MIEGLLPLFWDVVNLIVAATAGWAVFWRIPRLERELRDERARRSQR